MKTGLPTLIGLEFKFCSTQHFDVTGLGGARRRMSGQLCHSAADGSAVPPAPGKKRGRPPKKALGGSKNVDPRQQQPAAAPAKAGAAATDGAAAAKKPKAGPTGVIEAELRAQGFKFIVGTSSPYRSRVGAGD